MTNFFYSLFSIFTVTISLNCLALESYQGLKFDDKVTEEGMKSIGLTYECLPECKLGLNEYGVEYIFETGIQFMGEKRNTLLVFTDDRKLLQVGMQIPFDPEFYKKLKAELKEKYKLHTDTTQEDINNLNKKIIESVASLYDEGHVMLMVTRNEFTKRLGIILIYQNKNLANNAIKNINSRKKSLKDEI